LDRRADYFDWTRVLALAPGSGRGIELEMRGQGGTDHPDADHPDKVVDRRRHVRFKLEVELCIYPRDLPVVRGHSVDLSESGIAVMLRDELPVGGVVRLEFTLAMGAVDVHALVCNRSAFRYGLQFLESASALDVIGRTCRQLAMEHALFTPETP
jgi:hypothetical protein